MNTEKPNYTFRTIISPSMFKRRDTLKELYDDANEDILNWCSTLRQHGKLVSVNVNAIVSVELVGQTVIITHESKNWNPFGDEDEPATRLQKFAMPADDFFHPVIERAAPQQLDLGDAK